MRAIFWPLLAMMLVQAMTMMVVVTVPVMAPAVAADFGVDASSVGYYQSCVFAGAAMLTVLSGTLVRRHGGVRVNQISLVVGAVGLLAIASANLPLAMAMTLLIGGSYGLATPGASHILARVAPAEHRGLIFSLKQSAVPIGGLTAGLLIPPIVEGYGWRTAIVVVVTMMVASILAIQPLRRKLDDDREPGYPVRLTATREAVALVLLTPALRPIVLVAFSFGAVQLSLFAFLVTYLVERVGLSLVLAGTVFAVMHAAGVVSRVLWGWVSDRYLGSRRLLAWLALGIVASTGTAAFFSEAWPLWAIVTVCAALGMTAVGWNGVYLAEVARAVPLRDVGPATGGVLMFTFVGVMVGPSAFSAIVALSGSYTVAFLSFDVLVLLTAIMLFRKSR